MAKKRKSSGGFFRFIKIIFILAVIVVVGFVGFYFVYPDVSIAEKGESEKDLLHGIPRRSVAGER